MESEAPVFGDVCKLADELFKAILESHTSGSWGETTILTLLPDKTQLACDYNGLLRKYSQLPLISGLEGRGRLPIYP